MAINDNANETYLALPVAKLQGAEASLRQILANTLFMYQLYKKYHWHVRGEDFYQYHLLFDKHADEQLPLVDLLAERMRTLGLDAPGMPQDVVDNASLTEPEEGDFAALTLVKNLLDTHDKYISEVRKAADETEKQDDLGTNDLLVSEILRVHELQVWFLRSSLPKRS